MQHVAFELRKIANVFFLVGQSRENLSVAQHTHFESQLLQHTLFGSRKVASYLFWVALGRSNILVAQSLNMPILSRNGRNISPRPRPGYDFFGLASDEKN